jgi:hypothetical protein
VDELKYQCAVCGQTIEDRRLIGTVIKAGQEIPMSEFYFHRSCLASVLHPSVSGEEVFDD